MAHFILVESQNRAIEATIDHDTHTKVSKKMLEKFTEAENEVGDSGEEIKPSKNFDMDKFDRGRKFMQIHIPTISLGMFTSLVCGLSVRNLLEPLIYTGNSDTPQKAFRRYESTFVQVCRWCFGNIWDPDDLGYKSIKLVRNMHNSVRKSMMEHEAKNENLSYIQTETKSKVTMRISQYEMSLVQAGFFGPVILNPLKFGIKCSETEMDDFVYFWYGVGYALGIKDQNNICLNGYKEARQICLEISDEIVIPALKNRPKDFEKMAKVLTEGSNIPFGFPFNNFFSVESIVAIGFYGIGEKLPWLSIGDYVRFYILRFVIWMIFLFPIYERFLSKMIRKIYWESPTINRKYKL
ncbi:hypothetical protein LOTGIDRAFT_161432 [Lottia gigantea]|uniref:ER-bound oxygenase mpaB/mpaB'/Rubber oxygenase catalytic domain-containing protein n=1 Tax=Lottia gigantea TaxID=225164 RepID=V4BYK7_LOTGI|nr:hypothetical protein LOTGIDRAFT_161432 [Lottia gigantea]ESO94224.1 hypothetical protein LOTGIDRAFT_161432 [Lottia gigantea]